MDRQNLELIVDDNKEKLKYSTFFISKEHSEKILAWDKCRNKYHGAIGGHLTYSFIPTSLGLILTVKCSHCKEELDLSDYLSW